MAIRTFDLVVGDMLLMHELSGIFGRKDLGFIMALDAFSLWDMAIPLNHIVMASLTFHSSCNILPVVKVPAFNFDIPFGLRMAGDTASHGTRKAFLFPLWTSPVVVTDEAVGFMDCEMCSLNELGMAGSTAKLHPPSQFAYMLAMGKGHVFVNHILLEVIYRMASLLKAGRIVDLCMGFARSFTRKEVSEGNLTVHPLSF
jgi:hypothetical protein